jgi:glucose-6-phosphate isomerase
MKISFPEIQKFAGLRSIEKADKIALESLKILLHGKGLGNDFLGWLDLPEKMLTNEYDTIISTAKELRQLDTIIVIGIGGSYLGAKAVIEALSPQFEDTKPEIIFAGNNLSQDYLSELLKYLNNKEFGIIVISKSGTTTEPAIAFRVLYDYMTKRFDKNCIKNRVIAITDANRGALKKLADRENFKTFKIADDVGGRFSVLSPVGLLPIAVAGFDIKKLLEGALIAKQDCTKLNNQNPAIKYAGYRNLLYAGGRKIEILVNYDSRLNYISEWWKQLFGESEGKNKKGIFPASVSFTTDLHSMGQYIQQGERSILETCLYINKTNSCLQIPLQQNDEDGLNYLAGKDIEYVNRKAAAGTLQAHTEGDVPNVWIEIAELNEFNIGYLLYFFEIACGISAYIINVNPFDQPGVEDYKRNMFKLLGKQ